MKLHHAFGITTLISAIGLIIFFSWDFGPAVNPDPNHTHADFAVWVNGAKFDFANERFMSGASTDPEHEGALHKYLHLHDGNGSVIHRHKPGLTLNEFFTSIGVGISRRDSGELCVQLPGQGNVCNEETKQWLMMVNGAVTQFNPEYVFQDTDKILIAFPKADGDQKAELDGYWAQMTDDACLYSRTCPERGDPPTENCIADPTVPCMGV